MFDEKIANDLNLSIIDNQLGQRVRCEVSQRVSKVFRQIDLQNVLIKSKRKDLHVVYFLKSLGLNYYFN